MVSDVVNVVAPNDKMSNELTPSSNSTAGTSAPGEHQHQQGDVDFESIVSPKLAEKDTQIKIEFGLKKRLERVQESTPTSSSDDTTPRKDPRHKLLAQDPNSSVSNCDSENEAGVICFQD